MPEQEPRSAKREVTPRAFELSRYIALAMNELYPIHKRGFNWRRDIKAVMSVIDHNNNGETIGYRDIYLVKPRKGTTDNETHAYHKKGYKRGLLIDTRSGDQLVDGGIVATLRDRPEDKILKKARQFRRDLQDDLEVAAGKIFYELFLDAKPAKMSGYLISQAAGLDAITIIPDENGREQVYFPDRRISKMLCVDQIDQGGDSDAKIARAKDFIDNNHIRSFLFDLDRVETLCGRDRCQAVTIVSDEGREEGDIRIKMRDKEIQVKNDTVVSVEDLLFDVAPLQQPKIRKQLEEIRASYTNKLGQQGEKDGVSLIVGRFQPPHLGHLFQILAALEVSQHVIIGLGSANPDMNFPDLNDPKAIQMDRDNPFPPQERKALLHILLAQLSEARGEDLLSRVHFTSLEDVHSGKEWHDDDKWFAKTMAAVKRMTKRKVDLDLLVGNDGWVKNVFQERGVKVLSVPLLLTDEGERYQSTAIREALRKGHDGNPPVLAPSGRHRLKEE